MDHHRTDPLFATASNVVQIWDETKCVSVYEPRFLLTPSKICRHLDTLFPDIHRNDKKCALQPQRVVGSRFGRFREDVHALRHSHWKSRAQKYYAGKCALLDFLKTSVD